MNILKPSLKPPVLAEVKEEPAIAPLVNGIATMWVGAASLNPGLVARGAAAILLGKNLGGPLRVNLAKGSNMQVDLGATELNLSLFEKDAAPLWLTMPRSQPALAKVRQNMRAPHAHVGFYNAQQVSEAARQAFVVVSSALTHANMPQAHTVTLQQTRTELGLLGEHADGLVTQMKAYPTLAKLADALTLALDVHVPNDPEDKALQAQMKQINAELHSLPQELAQAAKDELALIAGVQKRCHAEFSTVDFYLKRAQTSAS